jgi:hypothetical protein
MNLFRRLWRDKRGFLATTDLILLATIVVLGSIVGLVTFRNQVVQEFGDMSMAVGGLNQSYSYGASYGKKYDTATSTWVDDTTKSVAGSSFTDQPNFGLDPVEAGKEPAGIDVKIAPGAEGAVVTPSTPYE